MIPPRYGRPLNKNLPAIPKKLVLLFIAAAIVGFSIATYLTVEWRRGVIPPCTIVDGCHDVLTSEYAAIGSLPTAALGIIYYLALIVLAAIYLDNGNIKFLVVASLCTVIGFIFSLYLVYLQIFVIKSVCSYCLASAGVSALLFIIDLLMWRSYFSAAKTTNAP